MGLKSIIEMLGIDLVAETLGALFCIGVLVWFVFGGGAQELFEAWVTSLSG